MVDRILVPMNDMPPSDRPGGSTVPVPPVANYGGQPYGSFNDGGGKRDREPSMVQLALGVALAVLLILGGVIVALTRGDGERPLPPTTTANVG
jgi:hypothetical protein